MPKRTKKSPTAVFRLRVELVYVAPPVWRLLLVPTNITLASLHDAVNEAMGWADSHLHMFMFKQRRFGDVTKPDAGELKLQDERKVLLEDVVGVGEVLLYEYDFGDGWTHHLKVEAKLEADERFVYPLCVGGGRTCPPEDCGGPPGYEHLVAALRDPTSAAHDDLLAWVGGHFDPEGFDVNRVNQALRGRR